MANTFMKIATVDVGAGGAASIDFTSIPATYTDLLLKISIRQTSSQNYEDMKITYNGTTTGYSGKQLYGIGSSQGSLSTTVYGRYGGFIQGTLSTSNTFSSTEVYIPNYASSNYKSSSIETVTENNATDAAAAIQSDLWSNTAAITSIKIQSDTTSSTIAQYSSATLYGIKNS